MYIQGIKKGIENGFRDEVISRKIYITYPTFAFKDNCEMEFELLNSISCEFKIQISSIQVVGSSKTGYSFYKNKSFEPGKSDLDVAIIDPILFQRYCEIVMKEANGFTDLSNFKKTSEANDYNSYKNYLAKGIFRPDFMPTCEAKRRWFNFFNKLSQRYNNLFSDINAGIYFSQVFFEYKQAESINFYKQAQL